MSKKKHDLITKGLTSELFLLAFLEPDNARKLGQRLQNTTGHPTNYSKVHPALHELTISGYLKHKDEQYRPNISKLIDDFDAMLQAKSNSFTMKEKEDFAQFLERREYLKILTLDVQRRLISQPKGEHKINALNVLGERLGFLATLGIIMLENFDEMRDLSDKELDGEAMTKLNEIDTLLNSKETKDNLTRELEKEGLPTPPEIFMLWDFLKSLPYMVKLFVGQMTLIKKIAMLWDQQEIFMAGLEAAKHLKKVNSN